MDNSRVQITRWSEKFKLNTNLNIINSYKILLIVLAAQAATCCIWITLYTIYSHKYAWNLFSIIELMIMFGCYMLYKTVKRH